MDHEKIGADYLRKQGFSEQIAKLVGSHVEAKRYLTKKYPDYFDKLSDASKKTLEFQGGKMSEEEVVKFEMDDMSKLYVSLRLWDEKAKEMNQPIPDLGHYKNMMLKHLSENKV